MEKQHMFWYDKPKDVVLKMPGTDITFKHGFDLRLERWSSREEALRICLAIFSEGVVGRSKQGIWVLFRLNSDSDPTMRVATPNEVESLEKLPDGWEDNMVVH